MYKIKDLKDFTDEKRYFNVYYSFLNSHAYTNIVTLFAFLRIFKSCIIRFEIEYPSYYLNKRCKELFAKGIVITVAGLKELIRNIPTSNIEEINKYLDIFKTCMSKMLFLMEIEQRRAIKY